MLGVRPQDMLSSGCAPKYNPRLLAAELMVKSKETALVRARQPLNEVPRGKKLPPWQSNQLQPASAARVRFTN